VRYTLPAVTVYLSSSVTAMEDPFQMHTHP
jgi:hypothetical protein